MNFLYQGDIPNNIKFANSIAVDTEAMGLKNSRDRLCLVQISSGDKNSHLIQVGAEFGYSAPNLKFLLKDNILPFTLNAPQIGIGRKGQIVKIGSGQHRLGIALGLSIDKVAFSLRAIHPLFLKNYEKNEF